VPSTGGSRTIGDARDGRVEHRVLAAVNGDAKGPSPSSSPAATAVNWSWRAANMAPTPAGRVQPQVGPGRERDVDRRLVDVVMCSWVTRIASARRDLRRDERRTSPESMTIDARPSQGQRKRARAGQLMFYPSSSSRFRRRRRRAVYHRGDAPGHPPRCRSEEGLIARPEIISGSPCRSRAAGCRESQHGPGSPHLGGAAGRVMETRTRFGNIELSLTVE